MQIFDWRENMPALFENGWGDGEGSKAGQARGTGHQRKRSQRSGMLAICSGDEAGYDSDVVSSPKSSKRHVKPQGSEDFRVRRHKSDGTVPSSKDRNKFITVGSIKNIHFKSLEEVYDPSGNKGYCLSSLCSLIAQGPSRLAVFDCKGSAKASCLNVVAYMILPIGKGSKDFLLRP